MDTTEATDIAIRIWPGKYSIDEVTTPNGKTFRLINLPFYYVGMLDRILDKNLENRRIIHPKSVIRKTSCYFLMIAIRKNSFVYVLDS